VSVGSYAVAIYILGKIDGLEMLLDRTNDHLGLDLIEKELPERIRSKKPL
jgi:hypothetical protein